jgi:hypothetical protein
MTKIQRDNTERRDLEHWRVNGNKDVKKCCKLAKSSKTEKRIERQSMIDDEKSTNCHRLITNSSKVGLEATQVDDIVKKRMADKDLYGGDSFLAPSPVLEKELIQP